MSATFRKLADGSWGIRSEVAIASGQTVEVHTRAGAIKRETVEALHGTEEGAFLYFIRRSDAPAARQTAAVGDMAGVLALFAKAAHLKNRAIMLRCGTLDIRLTIATARAQVPGSINVVDETSPDGRWLGRVLVAGTFEASRKFSTPREVTDQLVALARDPADVAAAYGRLTGKCAFCGLPLSDEKGRSQAVGYGRKCAQNYGLPWGAAKHTFRAEAVPAQQSMEW